MADKDRFIQIFSKNIRTILIQLKGEFEYVQEVRLRVNAPLFAIYKNQEYSIDKKGQLHKNTEDGYLVTQEDVEETLSTAARHSLYAFEEELKQGFITVPGGHRIGVAGRTVMGADGIKTIQPAASLNIRFAHQIKGCGDFVMPYLYANNLQKSGTEEFFHTLIISPPCCGKTTLLRDIVRRVSDGNGIHRGRNVAVVDERSEIGACYRGVPQNEVGIRTDILDGCPKAEGMMILIRSMSPAVVAVDEIGGKKDLEAVRFVMNCGCKILASVHGTAMEDIKNKPVWRDFLEEKIFERYVILSRRNGPGTIEDICDREGNSLICG